MTFLEVKGSIDSGLSYKLFPNLNFFSFTQITFSKLRSENGDVLHNPVAFQSLRGRKNLSCTKNGSLVISAMPRIVGSDVSPLPGSTAGDDGRDANPRQRRYCHLERFRSVVFGVSSCLWKLAAE